MADLISHLSCPKCRQTLGITGSELVCDFCTLIFPILENIPRFVPKENYAESFGLQWNHFTGTQLDSRVGTSRSEERFSNETLWGKDVLENRLILDAGCGAGRFSEIALKFGAALIAVDYSSAVNVAHKNLSAKNRLIVQGDLAALPISNDTFDYIYCIGVLQHTSNPQVIVKELIRCLKIDGELTLTFYENSSWHVKFYSKYLVRPITKRLPKQLLLKIIEKSAPVWFPLTSFLYSLPNPLSKILKFMIPIVNYVDFEYTTRQNAVSEAILDTFDMLSPTYDKPIKKSEVQKWVNESGSVLVSLNSKPKVGTMRFKKISNLD
jgi:SAM-dependent methyltransferase